MLTKEDTMKKYIRYWLLAVWMVCMTIIGGCSQILDTAQTSQVLYETETEIITEMLAEDGVYKIGRAHV